jgi:hypothetical protein
MELGCSPSSGEVPQVHISYKWYRYMLHLARNEPGPTTMTASVGGYFNKELAIQLFIRLFGTSTE